MGSASKGPAVVLPRISEDRTETFIATYDRIAVNYLSAVKEKAIVIHYVSRSKLSREWNLKLHNLISLWAHLDRHAPTLSPKAGPTRRGHLYRY